MDNSFDGFYQFFGPTKREPCLSQASRTRSVQNESHTHVCCERPIPFRGGEVPCSQFRFLCGCLPVISERGCNERMREDRGCGESCWKETKPKGKPGSISSPLCYKGRATHMWSSYCRLEIFEIHGLVLSFLLVIDAPSSNRDSCVGENRPAYLRCSSSENTKCPLPETTKASTSPACCGVAIAHPHPSPVWSVSRNLLPFCAHV